MNDILIFPVALFRVADETLLEVKASYVANDDSITVILYKLSFNIILFV